MPKLKTHSGTKDRIRITKNGKVMRRRSMRSHFLAKKSASRKRRMAGVEEINGKTSKSIKLNLGSK